MRQPLAWADERNEINYSNALNEDEIHIGKKGIPMDNVWARLMHCRQIALMAVMLCMAAACSRQPVWSTDEIENSKHFFLSLAASHKAVKRVHNTDPDEPQFGIEEINKYQKTALGEARLVKDAVLDKAHPDLKRHFRSEYQQGLELIMKSYEVASSSAPGAHSSEQIRLQASGVALLKRWTDWFDAHHLEIRLPRQSSTAPG